MPSAIAGRLLRVISDTSLSTAAQINVIMSLVVGFGAIVLALHHSITSKFPRNPVGSQNPKAHADEYEDCDPATEFCEPVYDEPVSANPDTAMPLRGTTDGGPLASGSGSGTRINRGGYF